MSIASYKDWILQRFSGLGPDHLRLVGEIRVGEAKLPAGGLLAKAGNPATHAFMLLDGWAGLFSHIPHYAPQLVDVMLPGDVAGIWGCLAGKYGHSLRALTPLRYSIFDGATLAKHVGQHGKFGLALMRQLAEDELRREAFIARLRSGAAIQRLAHLFLDVTDRLKVAGHPDETMCVFPLQRSHLAMLAGISEVHVSRTLADLRRQGLIALANNILLISDRQRLAETARVARPSARPRSPESLSTHALHRQQTTLDMSERQTVDRCPA